MYDYKLINIKPHLVKLVNSKYNKQYRIHHIKCNLIK